MNYLQAINKVLRRLREDEVTSPDSTAYSKLIGEFVNDANRMVEDAWNWSALRREDVTNTVAGQRDYLLYNLTSEFSTLQVTNSTEKCFVNLGTERELQEDKFINPATETVPSNYVYTGYDEDAKTMGVALYPVPDKAYVLNFNIVDRSGELTTSQDTIKVPSLPVIQLAQSMAVEERGETGGTTAAKLQAQAMLTLSDAIAYDAARFPTETVWYAV